MTFMNEFDEDVIHHQVHISRETSASKAETLLSKSSWNLSDLPTLISPAMANYIETLANQSHQLTVQRFGRTIQLFAPMYLSNECYNRCTYCGFSLDHKYPRKTLTETEIQTEYAILKKKGFQHILLLTGEAPGTVGPDYIGRAIELATNTFDSVGIEVQPFTQSTYETLVKLGADNVSLYQETYHQETYQNHHLSGRKRHYHNRLRAVEAAGAAGFYKLSVGALLGLYDWRFEALSLAQHIQYLQSRFWNIQFSVSFPRIKDMYGEYTIHHPISDSEFVQLLCSFRLLFPDLGITLSTRESSTFRDNLIPLGITTLSAESKTNPGGYSGTNSESQFDTSDTRSITQIAESIQSAGYDALYKDWIRNLTQ